MIAYRIVPGRRQGRSSTGAVPFISSGYELTAMWSAPPHPCGTAVAADQWLRIFEISLLLGSPEYPDTPSSLARFFSSATVQSS